MKTNKVTAIPRLRFPEFDGDWKIFYLNNVSHNLDSKRVPITSKDRKKGNIPYYGASGIIDYIDEFIFDDNLLCISEDGANLIDRVYPIAFSVTGKTWINNHAHVLKFENLWTQVIVESYLNHISLEKYLTGVAQPKLNKAKLNSIEIPLPKLKEQKKIADCLSSLDDLINAENEQLDALQEYKAGLLQQLFPVEGETTPKLRFAEFKDDGDWELMELESCLDYLQPTKYIVQSTDYKDKYSTPVLTAGKTFILGYTDEKTGVFSEQIPVIIFDDFTTASKFVDFPFKVKSSAMKILLAKDSFDIKFLYESIQNLDYETGVHKRHWISVFSKIRVAVPKLKEQQKIADCLSSLDNLIQAKDKQIDALKDHKQGLMQQLFPTQNM